jgi:hypothetical protein
MDKEPKFQEGDMVTFDLKNLTRRFSSIPSDNRQILRKNYGELINSTGEISDILIGSDYFNYFVVFYIKNHEKLILELPEIVLKLDLKLTPETDKVFGDIINDI